MQINIRKGTEADVPAMFKLVKELALFEKAPEAVVNDEAQMILDGFGPDPIYKVFVAEDDNTKEVIGMCLYYMAYSTWKGKLLYLDDLIVTESYRRSGAGRLLLNEFIKEADRLGVKQVRWHVLDWNQPAIDFYTKYGVDFDAEWIKCALTREEIQALAAKI
jgi:ribosomal protein S18 acetylase RimI-like enzyme